MLLATGALPMGRLAAAWSPAVSSASADFLVAARLAPEEPHAALVGAEVGVLMGLVTGAVVPRTARLDCC